MVAKCLGIQHEWFRVSVRAWSVNRSNLCCSCRQVGPKTWSCKNCSNRRTFAGGWHSCFESHRNPDTPLLDALLSDDGGDRCRSRVFNFDVVKCGECIPSTHALCDGFSLVNNKPSDWCSRRLGSRHFITSTNFTQYWCVTKCRRFKWSFSWFHI